MIKSIQRSLGAKIILFFGGILCLVLYVITFLNFSAQKAVLLERGMCEAKDLGGAVLTAIKYPMINGTQDIIQQNFNNYKYLESIKSINLLDHNGIIKRSTDHNMLEKRDLSVFVDSALLGNLANGIHRLGDSKEFVFTEARPIFNEESCYSCHGKELGVLGVLVISLDWNPVVETIKNSRNLNIAVSIIGLGIVSILTIFIVFKIVIAPILRVEQGLRRVSEGKLDERLPDSRQDEIGRVSKMFNKMLSDIKGSIGREKELRHAEQLKSKELEETISLINATLESTADGILVIDNTNKVTRYNKRFLDIWGLADKNINKANANEVGILLGLKLDGQSSIDLSVDKDSLDIDRDRFNVFMLNDGKIIESASKPQKIGNLIAGRVWSFRDVTEQKNAEMALQNKMAELERFNRFVIGREIKMKELKEHLVELKQKLHSKKNEYDSNGGRDNV